MTLLLQQVLGYDCGPAQPQGQNAGEVKKDQVGNFWMGLR